MSKPAEKSENPLLDKKIERKVLKTHAYSTPWDAPIYEEKVVSNQKYSKIESVFEIPYYRNPQHINQETSGKDLICALKERKT